MTAAFTNKMDRFGPERLKATSGGGGGTFSRLPVPSCVAEQAQLSALKSENLTLRGRIAELTRQLRSRDAEIGKLKAQAENLNRQIARLGENYRDALAQKEQELSATEKRIRHIEAEKKTLIGSNAAQLDRIAALRNTATVSSGLEKQVKNLRGEVSVFQNKIGEKDRQIVAVSKRIEQIETERQRLTRDNGVQRQRILSLEKSLHESTGKAQRLKEIQNELASVSELKRRGDSKIAELNHRMKSIGSSNRSLLSEKQRLADENESQKRRIVSLEKTLSDSSVQAGKIAELNRLLSSANEIRRRSDRKAAELGRKLNDNISAHKKLLSEKQQLQGATASLRQQVGTLDGKLAAERRKNLALAKEHAELLKNNESAKKLLAEKESGIVELKAQLEQKARTVIELEDQLEALGADAKKVAELQELLKIAKETEAKNAKELKEKSQLIEEIRGEISEKESTLQEAETALAEEKTDSKIWIMAGAAVLFFALIFYLKKK